MKAVRLQSGTYRVNLFLGYDENGKQIRKSITDKDRRKCEAKAAQYALMYGRTASGRTIATAMDDYITAQSTALSPSTIRAYRSIEKELKANQAWFMRLICDGISAIQLQKLVAAVSPGKSAKTVKNYLGLVTAVIKAETGITISANLPKDIKEEPYIPSSDDIRLLLSKAEGSRLYIPMMLAIAGTMRRSEICALKWPDDFKGNSVHVYKAMVQGPDGYVIKVPKTRSSDRWIELPETLVDKIREQGFVCDYSPDQITLTFIRLVKKCGLPKFSFHKLRHYSASLMLGAGTPMTIVEKRGGWSHGSSALNNVYTHVLSEQERRETDKVNALFTEIAT